MLQIGIIGCGGIVERRHLPGLLERADAVRISALSDVSADRVNLLADRARVSVEHRYTDYHELLAREKLDVVIVATPPAYHEAPVVEATGHVPTILVEKPLATDVRRAERMIEAADRTGTRLGVVHNQLYRPAIEAAAEILARGELGMPFLYRDELLGASHRVGAGTELNWRTQRVHAGGGSLLDNGYHCIYLAERLLGQRVTSVQAQMSTFTHDCDVEDTAFVLLRHADGALSSIQSGWSITSGRYTAQRVYELHATEGSIVFDHQGAPLAVFRPGVEGWETPEVSPEREDDFGYYAFRDRFLDALATDAPLPNSAEDSYHVLAVIQAAYTSAQTGAAVHVHA